MHTSTLGCLAFALTVNAIPFARTSTNTTVQRRSADYNVVNVGDMPEAPQVQPVPSAPTTVIETVTAPGAPPQTVTVTVSPTPTSSPSSSALWATSTFGNSYATPSVTPNVTPLAPAPVEETGPRGFTAMDRLARAFGKSIDSHFSTRSSNLTREVARDIKTPSNETTAYSKLAARGFNSTESARFPRAVLNSTELGTASLKARGLNGTVYKA